MCIPVIFIYKKVHSIFMNRYLVESKLFHIHFDSSSPHWSRHRDGSEDICSLEFKTLMLKIQCHVISLQLTVFKSLANVAKKMKFKKFDFLWSVLVSAGPWVLFFDELAI